MKSAIDPHGNIIVIAETPADKNAIDLIGNPEIKFKGNNLNRITQSNDYILVIGQGQIQPPIPEQKFDTDKLNDIGNKLESLIERMQTEIEEKRKSNKLLNSNIEWQMGILKENMAKIFTKFKRLNKSNTENTVPMD